MFLSRYIIGVKNGDVAADTVAKRSDDLAKTNTGKTSKVVAERVNKDTVFSGHGSYFPDRGSGIVPDDASITVYSKPGAKITDTLGNAIEQGDDLSHVYKKTYASGDSFPDYVLHKGTGLNIKGKPITVTKDTPLSDLLKPGMGDCHWAACTHNPYEGANNLIYHTEGVVDGSVKKFVTVYNK